MSTVLPPHIRLGIKASKSLKRRATLALGASLLFLTACAGSPSALRPEGPVASRIAGLAWFLFVVGGLVWISYVGLFLFAIFKRRRAPREGEPGPAGSNLWVILGGVVIPAIILIVVWLVTLQTLGGLAGQAQPVQAAPPGDLTVQVVGHQWWWEIHYENPAFATANEIHIPVGRRVRIAVTSADVIHSFWVPELSGKIDLFPNRATAVTIQANQGGTYRGECAEYCGLQHAKMDFVVQADPPDQFATWLNQQSKPAPNPTDSAVIRGQQVFLGSACVYCHSIRGTNASGTLGPDLTHLASRQTIAAGTLPNSRGNLAGWVINSQDIKPGNKMPPMPMDGPDLQDLLTYLESLK